MAKFRHQRNREKGCPHFCAMCGLRMAQPGLCSPCTRKEYAATRMEVRRERAFRTFGT